MVVDGDPFPTGLVLLLGAENGVLAICKPSPAKANVLLGRIARGPLGDLLLLLGRGIVARGGVRGVHRHVAIRIGIIVVVILAFIFPLAIGKEGRSDGRCHVEEGLPFDVVGLGLGAFLHPNAIAVDMATIVEHVIHEGLIILGIELLSTIW
jgi:hypothetical protein